MAWTSYALAAAAVVGAGASVYSATRNPEMPGMVPPPPPASYYSYSDSGTTQQVWDSSKNAYVTKTNVMPIPDPPQKNFGLHKPTNTQSEKYGERVQAYNDALAQKQRQWEKKWTNDYNANKDNPNWWNGLDPAYKDQLQGWHDNTIQMDKDNKVRGEIRTKMLSNLNQTPADRIKAYDNYEKTFSAAMHKNVDEQYAKIVDTTKQNLESTGMTGSRADVDKTAALAGEKLKTDVDIAQQAVMAKENLSNTDRQWWLSLLNYTDQNARADTLTELQKESAGAQAVNSGTANIMGTWAAQNNDITNRWIYDLKKNTAITEASAGLAGSLGMAYAYGSAGEGGGGKRSPLTGSSSSYKPDMKKFNLGNSYSFQNV